MAYQEVIELYCKNCGGSLLPISEDFCKCQNCGATYTQLTAKKQQELLDSFLNKQTQEQLNALRSHLWQEVSAKYIDSKKVVSICLDIKNIYPDDFLANFYEVVCGDYEQGVIDFIDNIDCKENYELIEQVVNFLIKSLKSEYLLSVNNLIERAYKKNDLQKYNSLTTAFAEEAKKVQDGVYELNVSRDVFVAYSSADMAYVQQIVSALEEQGLTCFVAMRNLQHGTGAVNNYKQALETAMDNCKIFLFISSKNSRNFSCDAFKTEMPYIKKKDCSNLPAKYVNTSYDKLPLYLKKPRVQWRIDDFKNPALDRNINEFFSGLEYCYDVSSVVMRIVNIILDGFAVCNEDSEADKIRSQKEEQNRILQENLKNMFVQLEDGEWVSATECCEKILKIDSECSKAYIGKLMAKEHIKRLQNLHRADFSKPDISKLFDNACKYSNPDEYDLYKSQFNVYEEKRYEEQRRSEERREREHLEEERKKARERVEAEEKARLEMERIAELKRLEEERRERERRERELREQERKLSEQMRLEEERREREQNLQKTKYSYTDTYHIDNSFKIEELKRTYKKQVTWGIVCTVIYPFFFIALILFVCASSTKTKIKKLEKGETGEKEGCLSALPQGACYIATCVYGSYDCSQVWTLRRFRDNTLGSTWYGRIFIKLYYAISPILVKLFGKTKWFKKMWKGILDRMVKNLNGKGVEDTPYNDKQWN